VRGVSLGMHLVFSVGITPWLVYGLLLGAWPLVPANAVTPLPSLATLAVKLPCGRRRD
jgi:MtN3 and saliva related transmembrane protein